MAKGIIYKKLVKYRHVVFEYVSRQTNKQTDMQTLIAILRTATWAKVINQ